MEIARMGAPPTVSWIPMTSARFSSHLTTEAETCAGRTNIRWREAQIKDRLLSWTAASLPRLLLFTPAVAFHPAQGLMQRYYLDAEEIAPLLDTSARRDDAGEALAPWLEDGNIRWDWYSSACPDRHHRSKVRPQLFHRAHVGYVSPLRCDRNTAKICWATYTTMVPLIS